MRRALITVALLVAWGALVCVAGVRAAAAQVTVAVSAPASVAAHTPVLVRVEVNAPAGAYVRLAPPSFAPFRLTRTDRAPTDTAGLRGRQRLEWRFVLLASDAGTFAFEPFEADVQGPGLRPGTFRSLPWSVAVSPAPVRAPPAGVAAAPLATADPTRLAFDAQLTPAHVYVGEQTTLELRVGVGARVRERLRRSPEFAFPSVSGVVTYDLSARHASSTMGDVHVYRRALFPLAPGVVDVPAAQLTYALSPEGDPFGVEERVSAQTPVRHVVAIAPPVEGRPATWDGAVGAYRASARVDTAHARVGDVVVYTLRVEGVGNVLLLPRPALAIAWADVAIGSERVTVDSSGDLAGGAKEFDWLLTPRTAGDVRIPGVRVAYFDPRSATYAAADAATVALRVAPGAAAPAVASAASRRTDPPVRSELGVRRHWTGERAPPAVARRGFWLALAAVPAPGALVLVAAASVARVRRRRAARALISTDGRDTPRARATAALAEFTSGVSRLIGGPGARTLDLATLVGGLRRAGVGRALVDESVAATDAWTRVAYAAVESAAPPSAPVADPLRTAGALLSRIARELELRDVASRSAIAPGSATPTHHAPAPVRLPRHAYAGVAVGLAVLAVALAAPQLSPRATVGPPATDRADAISAFDAGVAAYADGDAARARDLFVAAAAAAPTVPVAWLNAGTAAWAVADTAGAAFAWQRAARLAPTVPGLRDRLERLPSVAAFGHLGAPPAVDPNLVSALALVAAATAALWMTLAAASHVRRAPPAASGAARAPAWSGAITIYLLAVTLGGAAAFAAHALAARGFAVVRAPVVLRSEPAAGAFGATPVATGEVAQLIGDEGGWRRVRLDGDRDGWLRSAQLAPLDGPP